MAQKRIMKELKDIGKTRPISGFMCGPVEDDLFHWEATLLGPQDTPYAGGLYFLDI